MNHELIISQLKNNHDLFRSLLTEQEDTFVNWKPTPEKWNLLEITCHLLDEEREDFRARIKHTLSTPKDPLPAIDPPAWVLDRKYAEQSFPDVVKNFLTERENSIKWLNSLSNVNWKEFYVHPTLGNMSAELFLANWLAHDYLHIRQILSLRFQYLKFISGESLNYAGEW